MKTNTWAFALHGGAGAVAGRDYAETEKHLAGAGAAGVPVVIQGMEDSAEFADVILRGVRDDMDLDKVESELLAAGRQLVARAPEIGAILLECTDLPPYAHALQRELQRPVFDIITLASMVHSAVLRGSYAGFIR